MTEFTSAWLEYTPVTTEHLTDKTDKRAFVSFVSATFARATPDSGGGEAIDAALEPHYRRLRAIYASDDFDTPQMVAERSKINQVIYEMKYANVERSNR